METSALNRRGPPRLRLQVSPRAESALRGGDPWLFAQSIREQNREGQLGELAIVYDRRDRFLAAGLYDPYSPLRVRILQLGRPQAIDRTWWSTRLRRALEKRAGLFDTQTTAWRWINGESDGWPGLVLDRYERVLVLKLYTAAWLPLFEQICELLESELEPYSIVLRLSRNSQSVASQQFGLSDGQIVFGREVTQPVVFLESGLWFEADVLRGQKTGFFLDQRENRRRVGELAKGRTVLNAFSFSGAFSIYAARGGARSATDLDINAHALSSGARNVELNRSIPGIKRCTREPIRADAFKWLAGNTPRHFDLIVLDPPSMAKRESERVGAIRAYRSLVSLGAAHLSPGGILVASSCSAHVSATEFFDAVRKSLTQAGRHFKELQTTGHAPDHPATFPAAEYLKAIFCRVEK